MKNKEAENLLELCSHQHVEMERYDQFHIFIFLVEKLLLLLYFYFLLFVICIMLLELYNQAFPAFVSLFFFQKLSLIQ